MNEKIVSLAYLLKTELDQHSDVLHLLECEELLKNDKAVLELNALYQEAQLHLSNVVNENKYVTVIKEAQQNLFNIKYALDTNELVKKYNEVYRKVSKLYKKVNDALFGPYKVIKGCVKR